MDTITAIEAKLLNLSPSDREILALTAWESLANDSGAEADVQIDPDGIILVRDRNSEIESGVVKTLDEAEFKLRTATTLDAD